MSLLPQPAGWCRQNEGISTTIHRAMFLVGYNEYGSSLTKLGFALLALQTGLGYDGNAASIDEAKRLY